MATLGIATVAVHARVKSMASDLTSTARCKRVLGIPSGVTIHDALLDDLVAVADQQVLSYCGMAALTSTTVTEVYDIEAVGTTELSLRQFPVSNVAAVQAAGATLSATAWYVDKPPGTLRLTGSGQFFPAGRQQVAVTYTYGYSTVPADLQHAATLCAVAEFNRARHAGMSSEGMTGYRYSLDGSALPPAALVILARYVRIFPKDRTS